MIKKAYEISCDHCGGGQPDHGNRGVLVQIWREQGWIFSKGHHFCTEKCERRYWDLIKE